MTSKGSLLRLFTSCIAKSQLQEVANCAILCVFEGGGGEREKEQAIERVSEKERETRRKRGWTACKLRD